MRQPANRRQFLKVSIGGAAAAMTAKSGFAAFVHSAGQQASELPLDWYNVEDWGVEGRGWPKAAVKRFFDRLPAKAEGVVRDEVWNLSRDSAGMLSRFSTDSPLIHVDYALFRERLALPHMPATGVSGVDLYGEDSEGRWRWVAVSKPQEKHVKAELINGLDGTKRKYTLYLPLYNGVDRLMIGVPKGASFSPIEPRRDPAIVFYGTSITHGACASRPGMPHPAILGRRLNRPIINLGFSGNGRMEKEVGALLTELEAAAYVIDCLPNMDDKLVRERTEPLVSQLREARPRVPIVLVEDRSFTNAWIRPESRSHHEASRRALREAYENLRKRKMPKLYYIKGEQLLGDDSEGATDGSHPSDLGFMRQAAQFEPILREALR